MNEVVLEKEPRKATDVLLDLESKIETLLQIVRSQDLNIKLLSNKLNVLIDKAEKKPEAPTKIVVEAVNTIPSQIASPVFEEKNIQVSSDFNISAENNPQGFRRTSRPETFSGDNMYLNRGEETVTKFPMQLPKMPVESNPAEVVVPNVALKKSAVEKNNKSEQKDNSSTSVPVVQRIVDKNGKSIFLAEVEILSLDNAEPIVKTRTNGTGKWMASLPIGSYKVLIRKRESVSKEKMESEQNIHVDGTQSPLELQTMIIR